MEAYPGACGGARRGGGEIELRSIKKDIHLSELRGGEVCVEVSSRKILITYPYAADAWAAVGIFLDRYCGVSVFAPSELGRERSARAAFSPRCGRRTFPLAFAGRSLGIYQKGAAEVSSLNGSNGLFAISSHNIPRLAGRAENPEWFSENCAKIYPPRLRQIDFDNLEMRAHISIAAREWLSKNPRSKIVSLGYADNGRFGLSAFAMRSSRGFTARGYRDYSNGVFDFTNDIARRVGREFPDRFVAQLAYLRTENPPDFRLEKNVAVALCTDKGNWFDPAQRAIDEKLIKDWAASGAGLLCVHDYNYGANYLIPRETSEYIAESIKDYAAAGFAAYYAECYPVWAYDAHKIWIACKLLKDPSLSYCALRREFFDSYYLEAGRSVEKFFDIARGAWRSRTDKPALWLKLYKRPSQVEIFSGADIAAMERALSEAERAAKSKRVAARVAELRLVFDITKTSRRIYFYQKKLWLAEPDPKNAPEILAAAEALKAAYALACVQLCAYRERTKYPVADFKTFDLLKMLDPSAMRLRELAALGDKNFSPRALELLGGDYPALAGSAAARVSEKNLLKNPSFEDGLRGWSVLRFGTCREAARASGKAARSGKAGVEIASVEFAGIGQKCAARGGAFYECSLFARGKIGIGATHYLRLKFLESRAKGGAGRVSAHYLQLPAGDFPKFKKLSIAARAPDWADSAECAFISVNAPDSEPALIDDFSLREIDF